MSINNTVGTGRLDDATISKIFDRWWNDLKSSIDEIIASQKGTSPSPKSKVSMEETVNELLMISREQFRIIRNSTLADERNERIESRNTRFTEDLRLHTFQSRQLIRKSLIIINECLAKDIPIVPEQLAEIVSPLNLAYERMTRLQALILNPDLVDRGLPPSEKS